MAEQPLLPTLGWPALVPKPGPAFFLMELQGKPGHKARHRSRIVFPKNGKAFIHNYPDPDTEAYEKVLAEYAGLLMRNKSPVLGPVALMVHSFRAIPKSWSTTDQERALAANIRPTSRPDWDNFGKITDALNLIVWHDDSQVVDGRSLKYYSDRPALRIEVREMVEP